MDREAIIENVSRKLEVSHIDVRHILENGGFLDLLEAAEKAQKAHCCLSICQPEKCTQWSILVNCEYQISKRKLACEIAKIRGMEAEKREVLQGD